MKLLIFSDSHGTVSDLVEITERQKPDLVLFLGDCWSDFQHLRFALKEIPMEGVPGNCDYQPTEPQERLLELCGKRVLICHGHTRRVKCGLEALKEQGHRMGADLVLYGHTHIPHIDRDGEMWVMNPGAMTRYGKQSFGVVLLDEQGIHPRLCDPDKESKRY